MCDKSESSWPQGGPKEPGGLRGAGTVLFLSLGAVHTGFFSWRKVIELLVSDMRTFLYATLSGMLIKV